MGYVGDPFTWRRGDIRERLDRTVCNVEGAYKFPRAAIINEEHVHSDHHPLILDMNYYDNNMFSRPKSRVNFFEARWLKEETIEEIVKMAWEKAKMVDIGPSLTARTRVVHVDLHSWDCDTLKGLK